jgi:hypothetical protein
VPSRSHDTSWESSALLLAASCAEEDACRAPLEKHQSDAQPAAKIGATEKSHNEKVTISMGMLLLFETHSRRRLGHIMATSK